MECILQRTIQFTTSSKVTWLWSVTLQTFQSYRKRLNWPKAVWMERNHLSLTTHQQSFSNMKGKKQLRSLPCCVEKFGRAKSSPKNDCSCLSYPFQRKRTQPVSNQPIKQGKGDPKLPQYCCWWGVSGRASLLQSRQKHSSTDHQQSHHHKKKNIDDIIKFKTVFDTVWHKSLWCVTSFKPLKCYKEAKGNLYSWTTTQKQTFARPASYHLCSTSFWRHHLIPLVGGITIKIVQIPHHSHLDAQVWDVNSLLRWKDGDKHSKMLWISYKEHKTYDRLCKKCSSHPCGSPGNPAHSSEEAQIGLVRPCCPAWHFIQNCTPGLCGSWGRHMKNRIANVKEWTRHSKQDLFNTSRMFQVAHLSPCCAWYHQSSTISTNRAVPLAAQIIWWSARDGWW